MANHLELLGGHDSCFTDQKARPKSHLASSKMKFGITLSIAAQFSLLLVLFFVSESLGAHQEGSVIAKGSSRGDKPKRRDSNLNQTKTENICPDSSWVPAKDNSRCFKVFSFSSDSSHERKSPLATEVVKLGYSLGRIKPADNYSDKHSSGHSSEAINSNRFVPQQDANEIVADPSLNPATPAPGEYYVPAAHNSLSTGRQEQSAELDVSAPEGGPYNHARGEIYERPNTFEVSTSGGKIALRSQEKRASKKLNKYDVNSESAKKRPNGETQRNFKKADYSVEVNGAFESPDLTNENDLKIDAGRLAPYNSAEFSLPPIHGQHSAIQLNDVAQMARTGDIQESQTIHTPQKNVDRGALMPVVLEQEGPTKYSRRKERKGSPANSLAVDRGDLKEWEAFRRNLRSLDRHRQGPRGVHSNNSWRKRHDAVPRKLEHLPLAFQKEEGTPNYLGQSSTPTTLRNDMTRSTSRNTDEGLPTVTTATGKSLPKNGSMKRETRETYSPQAFEDIGAKSWRYGDSNKNPDGALFWNGEIASPNWKISLDAQQIPAPARFKNAEGGIKSELHSLKNISFLQSSKGIDWSGNDIRVDTKDHVALNEEGNESPTNEQDESEEAHDVQVTRSELIRASNNIFSQFSPEEIVRLEENFVRKALGEILQPTAKKNVMDHTVGNPQVETPEENLYARNTGDASENGSNTGNGVNNLRHPQHQPTGSWFDAFGSCLQEGAILATLETEEYDQIALDLTSDIPEACWIGLRKYRLKKPEKGWYWINSPKSIDDESDYLNWGEELDLIWKILPPAEKCGEINNDGWNGRPCWGLNSRLSCFVCSTLKDGKLEENSFLSETLMAHFKYSMEKEKAAKTDTRSNSVDFFNPNALQKQSWGEHNAGIDNSNEATEIGNLQQDEFVNSESKMGVKNSRTSKDQQVSHGKQPEFDARSPLGGEVHETVHTAYKGVEDDAALDEVLQGHQKDYDKGPQSKHDRIKAPGLPVSEGTPLKALQLDENLSGKEKGEVNDHSRPGAASLPTAQRNSNQDENKEALALEETAEGANDSVTSSEARLDDIKSSSLDTASSIEAPMDGQQSSPGGIQNFQQAERTDRSGRKDAEAPSSSILRVNTNQLVPNPRQGPPSAQEPQEFNLADVFYKLEAKELGSPNNQAGKNVKIDDDIHNETNKPDVTSSLPRIYYSTAKGSKNIITILTLSGVVLLLLLVAVFYIVRRLHRVKAKNYFSASKSKDGRLNRLLHQLRLHPQGGPLVEVISARNIARDTEMSRL